MRSVGQRDKSPQLIAESIVQTKAVIVKSKSHYILKRICRDCETEQKRDDISAPETINSLRPLIC
jgi:hypothetical protein